MSPAATHKRRLQILQVSLNHAPLNSVGTLAFVPLLHGTIEYMCLLAPY